MGLPVVGLLVKLVDGGIGLAAEANAARKKRPSSTLGETAQKSITPGAHRQSDDPPPPYTEQYVEVSPAQSEELIVKSHAYIARDSEACSTIPHSLQPEFAVHTNNQVGPINHRSLAPPNTNGSFTHRIPKAQRKHAKRERKAIRREEKHARRWGHYE
ncbi:hypothetical protein MMC17_003885 [Xylographa soralifera]|nr:hypothetical protein [Xylographa soralifera]